MCVCSKAARGDAAAAAAAARGFAGCVCRWGLPVSPLRGPRVVVVVRSSSSHRSLFVNPHRVGHWHPFFLFLIPPFRFHFVSPPQSVLMRVVCCGCVVVVVCGCLWLLWLLLWFGARFVHAKLLLFLHTTALRLHARTQALTDSQTHARALRCGVDCVPRLLAAASPLRACLPRDVVYRARLVFLCPPQTVLFLTVNLIVYASPLCALSLNAPPKYNETILLREYAPPPLPLPWCVCSFHRPKRLGCECVWVCVCCLSVLSVCVCISHRDICSTNISLSPSLPTACDFIEKSVSLSTSSHLCVHPPHSCLNVIIPNAVCFAGCACFIRVCVCVCVLSRIHNHKTQNTTHPANNDTQFCSIFQIWNFTPNPTQYPIPNSGHVVCSVLFCSCAYSPTHTYTHTHTQQCLAAGDDLITTPAATHSHKCTFTFDLDVVWSFV